MQLGMAQVTSSLTFSARNVAMNTFARAYIQSHLHRLWARLTRRPYHLLDLNQSKATARVYNRHYEGIQTVSLDHIRGSENRCGDFDDHFHPLHPHHEERWIGVATVMLQGGELPPVDLIKLGETYFVRDGHHRISVARTLGQKAIEAVVTEWRTN